MDLSGHIADLVTMAKSMKKDPSVDKEWLNRTISHLLNAQATSVLLKPGHMNGVTRPQSNAFGAPADSRCTCPDGVADANCPLHGNK